jgi:MoaA/NifB/PqqE/SkfB family radical SAM enzyme
MPVSWVVFHLTDRCQLDCRHCLRDPALRPSDLPVAIVEKVLDEAIALHAVGHVGLTGGEPALHPELEAVVDAIVRRGLGWHLVSNGSRFSRVLALLDGAPGRRAALTSVDLSLDGARPETHDAIRGAGSHREVMAAALACQARGIPFMVQMTVNALNAAEVEELGLAAAELGAGRVSYSMTQATGSVHDRDLWLAPEGWGQVKDRIDRLATVLRIPVTAAEGFQRPQPFHVCEAWRSELLHVDPRGRLTLCCQLSGTPGPDADVMGDLRTERLADAHRRLLDHVHALQRERLDAIAAGPLRGFDLFSCNACLRRHGKPHWTDAGSAGPQALRARSRAKDGDR